MSTAASERKEPVEAEALVRQSPLCQELEAERQEILKHKWYESEKTGHDIGFDLARVDWVMRYGRQWHKQRRKRSDR